MNQGSTEILSYKDLPITQGNTLGLTSYEDVIRTYITERLQEKYPEINSGTGSMLNDLITNPLIEILKPMIDALNTASIVGDLSKAELMTTEELDDLGVSNYGITRKAAKYAGGYVNAVVPADYLVDTSVPFVIPPFVFATAAGNRYTTVSTYSFVFTADQRAGAEGIISAELVSAYNHGDNTYWFPLYALANEPGAAYNVEYGEVFTMVVGPTNISEVTAKTNFTGGEVGETNAEYAARIRSSFLTSAKGTSKGYVKELMENIVGVADVYVAGAGSQLMTRDRMVVRAGSVYSYKNMGGKVDLHIRGRNYVNQTHYAHITPTASMSTGSSYWIYPRHNDFVKDADAIRVTALFDPTLTYTVDNIDTISITTKGVTRDVNGISIAINYAYLPDAILLVTYLAYIDDAHIDTIKYTEVYTPTEVCGCTTLPYCDIATTPMVYGETTTSIDYSNLFTIPLHPKVFESGSLTDCSNVFASNLVQLSTFTETKEAYIGKTFVGYNNEFIYICLITNANDTGLLTLSGDYYRLAGNLNTSAYKYAITEYMFTGDYELQDSMEYFKGFEAPDSLLISPQIGFEAGNYQFDIVYNNIPEQVQDYYDLGEERIIGTEVTAIAARPMNIYLMVMYMPKVPSISETVSSYIASMMFNIVSEMFKSYTFGDYIYPADVTNTLNAVPEITQYMSIVYAGFGVYNLDAKRITPESVVTLREGMFPVLSNIELVPDYISGGGHH